MGFIGFELPGQWRAFNAPLAQAVSDAQVNVVDGTHRYAGQRGTLGGGQIQRKVANNLTKFRLADPGTSKIPVFSSHIRKLACHNSIFDS